LLVEDLEVSKSPIRDVGDEKIVAKKFKPFFASLGLRSSLQFSSPFTTNGIFSRK